MRSIRTDVEFAEPRLTRKLVKIGVSVQVKNFQRLVHTVNYHLVANNHGFDIASDDLNIVELRQLV